MFQLKIVNQHKGQCIYKVWRGLLKLFLGIDFIYLIIYLKDLRELNTGISDEKSKHYSYLETEKIITAYYKGAIYRKVQKVLFSGYEKLFHWEFYAKTLTG